MRLAGGFGAGAGGLESADYWLGDGSIRSRQWQPVLAQGFQPFAPGRWLRRATVGGRVVISVKSWCGPRLQRHNPFKFNRFWRVGLFPICLYLLAAPEVASAQGPAFNLICDVSGETGGVSRNFMIEFRIDISTMNYCSHECDTVEKFKMTDNEYILMDTIINRGKYNEVAVRNYIERRSGRYHSWAYSRNGRALHDYEGPCRKAAFTEFPSAKF